MDAAQRRAAFAATQHAPFRGGGHTRVTYNSWGSRMGSSVCGVCVGVLLLFGGIALLAWNEARVVRTAQSLAEGLDKVIEAPYDQVIRGNEGKLVHVTGRVNELPLLTDSEFGVSARGLQLKRDVEMYQTKEHVRTSRRKDNHGGEVVTKHYSYSNEWSSARINSNNFDDPSYSNPTHWPVSSSTESVRNVRFGGWTLDGHVLSKAGHSSTLPLHDQSIPQLGGGDRQRRLEAGRMENGKPVAGSQRHQMQQRGGSGGTAVVQGSHLYLSGSPYDPMVGDMRVSWTVTSADELSIVGQQRGDKFAPYQADAGDDILLVEAGVVSSKDMFAAAEAQNTMLCWVLRGVGTILIFVAFNMLFAPLSVAVEVIPCCGGFIGSIVGFGTCIVSTVLTMAVSLVTIAVAWIAQRPLLAVLLLVVAALPVLGLGCGKRKRGGGGAPMRDGKPAGTTD